MRWESLFHDLESQLAQELQAEDASLALEEERLRIARLSVRARLAAVLDAEPSGGRMVSGEDAAASESSFRFVLPGALVLDIRGRSIGRDWISGDELTPSGRRRPVVVALAAVQRVHWTPAQLAQGLTATPEEAGKPASRISLGFVLRDLCRRRSAVEMVTRDGSVFGTIDRVGRDHIDLAEHAPGEARREAVVRGIVSLSFDGVFAVRH